MKRRKKRRKKKRTMKWKHKGIIHNKTIFSRIVEPDFRAGLFFFSDAFLFDCFPMPMTIMKKR
jgi:hypothetical protein